MIIIFVGESVMKLRKNKIATAEILQGDMCYSPFCGGMFGVLVIISPTIYFGFIFEKANEVKMWNDAYKRTFKTKQYKQN